MHICVHMGRSEGYKPLNKDSDAEREFFIFPTSHTAFLQLPNYLSTPGIHTWLNLPDAVPQQGGTHQAEEKMLVITSGGKRVTFRWIWSKFNTNARNTPIKNSTTPRITKFMPRLVTEEMYGPPFFDKVGIASFSAMTS